MSVCFAGLQTACVCFAVLQSACLRIVPVFCRVTEHLCLWCVHVLCRVTYSMCFAGLQTECVCFAGLQKGDVSKMCVLQGYWQHVHILQDYKKSVCLRCVKALQGYRKCMCSAGFTKSLFKRLCVLQGYRKSLCLRCTWVCLFSAGLQEIRWVHCDAVSPGVHQGRLLAHGVGSQQSRHHRTAVGGWGGESSASSVSSDSITHH